MTGTGRRLSHLEIEQILDLRLKKRMPVHLVAARFKVHPNTITAYCQPGGSSRTKHRERRLKARALYAEGKTVHGISRALGACPTSVRNWLGDLIKIDPNRKPTPAKRHYGTKKEDTVNKHKRVIVQYDSPDGTLQYALVQPTGRIDFTASASHPERQWFMEAVDLRDGVSKMFAFSDIKQWIVPDPAGATQSGIPLAEILREAA